MAGSVKHRVCDYADSQRLAKTCSALTSESPPLLDWATTAQKTRLPCPGSSDNILPATAVRNSSTPRCSRFSPTSSPSQFSRTLWPGSYWQRGSVDAVIVMAALVRLVAFAPSLKLLESRHFWALTVLQRGPRVRRGQYMVTVSQNMERPAPEADHSSPEQ